MGIVPSVSLLVDIPESTCISIMGKCVCFKDAAFEPSSPNCHMAELYKLTDDKPVLFLCCDRGPGHRLTHV